MFPCGTLVAQAVEVLVYVGGDFTGQACARLVETEHNARHFEFGIQAACNDADCLHQFAKAVQCKEVGQEREENVLYRCKGVDG